MKPFLKLFKQPRANPLETGEYDDFIFYSCHKSYLFGPQRNKIDELAEEMDENDFRDMIKSIKSGTVYHSTEQKAYFYPMFMLDHSGLSFSFTSFNDPWDSGLGAVVKVSDESVEEIGNTYKVFKKYKELIEAMNSFETDSEYGFIEVDFDTGDFIESIGGYDLKDLSIDEVKSAMGADFHNKYSDYEIQHAINHIEDY